MYTIHGSISFRFGSDMILFRIGCLVERIVQVQRRCMFDRSRPMVRWERRSQSKEDDMRERRPVRRR
jgi:hypothetical protein